MEPDAIQIAGDFKADRAIITTQTGEQINIILHVHQISIYEDLFSPFLTVELEIRDSIGLMHKMPFMGEEVLNLTVTDSDGVYGLQDAIFSVYKIKDIVQVSDRSYVYRLCCISIEAVVDMNLKISKAYSGLASDIVQTLTQSEGLDTQKNIIVEPTKNKIAYISNYWSPIQNIKYLSDRAVTRDGKSASCIFYETKMGFVFSSLNAMVAGDAVTSYKFGVAGMNDVEKGLERIEKIHIDVGFDYLERLQTGAYGNRALIVDPYNKTYDYSYYDFLDSFNSHNRLNPNPFSSDAATRRINSIFRTRVAPSRSYVDMMQENNEQWFKQRVTELASINAFHIQIEVAGRMDIVVGNVVEVYLYSGQIPQEGNAPNDFNEVLDNVYSGRYLITGIKHAMSKDRHTMNLILSKDSTLDIK